MARSEKLQWLRDLMPPGSQRNPPRWIEGCAALTDDSSMVKAGLVLEVILTDGDTGADRGHALLKVVSKVKTRKGFAYKVEPLLFSLDEDMTVLGNVKTA